jgi:ubiquinone/menaquinone biosynthesis C-methylase UbiE
MCGSGRFLIPFLERGIDIDGVDVSPYMLQTCRDCCEQKGLRPGLYEQFVQDLNLPRQYGYIFIPDGSFSLIVDRQAVLDSLKLLYAHLLPGGKLVIEVLTTKAQTDTPGEWSRSWFRRSDGSVIGVGRLTTYAPEEQVQRCISRYELHKNGCPVEIEHETVEVRLHSSDHFRNVLEATGFNSVRVNKAYGNAEPDVEDTSVVCVCRRP